MDSLTVPNSRAFEVTNRSVLAIAWPMTLAFITTPLLGLVDTGVVGRLGDAALLGGLAIGAILFDFIFGGLNFLRASTTGLVAQAMGAGDDKEEQAVFIRSLFISMIIGVAIALFAVPILALGLWLIEATPAVEEATTSYFLIRILAAPLTLANYTILGWMLGVARAGLGLALQTVLNGVNIALSIYLGLSLGWGIEGVAWATVIAEGVAVVTGLLIAFVVLRGAERPSLAHVLDGAALVRLFGVNRDIMIRSMCLLFAFAFFTAQGSKFGEITLAANAILMNFFLISGYFLDGFATAAEQLAGRAIGARYRRAFDRAVNLTLVWGFVLAGVATIFFFAAGPWMIDLLKTNEAVRAEARVFLFWAAITALAGVVAFQMDGVFIGATWSGDMRNMMLLSLVLYLIVWWVATPLIGNHGLWLALEVFLGVRGITLYHRLTKRREHAFAEN